VEFVAVGRSRSKGSHENTYTCRVQATVIVEVEIVEPWDSNVERIHRRAQEKAGGRDGVIGTLIKKNIKMIGAPQITASMGDVSQPPHVT
jgi:hypothetical protein